MQRGVSAHLQGVSFNRCVTQSATGAIMAANPGVTCEITDSAFYDCHVEAGAAGALFVESSAVAIVRDTTFKGCSADTSGGALYVNSDATLALSNSSIVDCRAKDGGALTLIGKSTAVLEGLDIANCSAAENGGGLSVGGESAVSILGTRIVGCAAKNGGALAISESTATLRLTLLANNVAELVGGGVFSEGSRILLAEQTAVVGNLASRPGHALALMIGSTTTYQLPAPPGRWIAGSKCAVYREDCPWLGVAPGRYQEESCLQTVAQCQLEANETAVVGGVACQPVSSSQPCDWRKSPELLGSSVQVLPQEPQDDDYPFDCAAGMVGAADATLQMSALCAGACPSGACHCRALPSICP